MWSNEASEQLMDKIGRIAIATPLRNDAHSLCDLCLTNIQHGNPVEPILCCLL